MVGIFPAVLGLIYFGTVISLTIFMICLFVRFVKAVEKIANSLENCCKNKTSQLGEPGQEN